MLWKNLYIRQNAQNLDEIGVFGKVVSMKSALFDVSRGVKERNESEKYTHFARESDVLRLVEEFLPIG